MCSASLRLVLYKNFYNATDLGYWSTVATVPHNTAISNCSQFTTDDPNFFKDTITK